MNNKRRTFLKQSLTMGVGVFILPRHVLGRGFIAPSDQINLGLIGTGVQGRSLMKKFSLKNQVRCVAASDVEGDKLNLFEQELIKSYKKNQPNWDIKGVNKYADYQELLNHKGLDAVVIATPDHWHAKNSIDSLSAGMDVYCEKPLAHTLKEGRMIADAVQKHDAVFQTGSMQRSSKLFRHAAELVRNGYIGEIEKVIVYVGDPAIPCDLPSEKAPDVLNWSGWLGSAPYRPYHSILSPPVEQRHFPRWRFYQEYGGGIIADWGAHMFDIAQWALGMDHTGPVRFIPPKANEAKLGLKMFYENGIEMVHDKFEIAKYGVKFIGSEGTLKVSRGFLETDPKNIADVVIGENDVKLYKSNDHYTDWINSIKRRKQPICDVEVGHRTSSVCQLSNIAYDLNRPLEWNPVKEKFIHDREANKLRSKKYRKPFKI
jgi:predicted dehydrogenase